MINKSDKSEKHNGGLHLVQVVMVMYVDQRSLKIESILNFTQFLFYLLSWHAIEQ